MLNNKYEEIPELHLLSDTELDVVEKHALRSLESEIRENNFPEEYARKRRYLLQRRIAKSRALVDNKRSAPLLSEEEIKDAKIEEMDNRWV